MGQADPLTQVITDAIRDSLGDIVQEEVRRVLRKSPFLTRNQAAEYLKINGKKMSKLLSDGVIPYTEDGNRYLIRESDLDAYIANRK